MATTPNGIEDSVRTDNFYKCRRDRELQDEPFIKDEKYYDGGWVLYGPDNRMYQDSGVIHEFGHGCLSLPDLYGYPVHHWGVLLEDENGGRYAGGDLMPILNSAGVVTLTSAICVPCGEGSQSM